MVYFCCATLESYLYTAFRYGHLLFLTTYWLSHLGGALLITVRHYRDPGFTSAGASGGILGCMFCFMILQPDFVAFYLPLFGPVNNLFACLIFIVMLIRLQFKTQDLFNHELHFYAAITGGLIGLVMKQWS